MRQKKAQSTLEYVLVITAIIGVIIYAAVHWIQPAVQGALNSTNTEIGDSAAQF